MYNDSILFSLCFIFLVQMWKSYTSHRFVNVVVTSDVSRESMIKAAKTELKRIHLSSDHVESLVDVQALYNITESMVGSAQVVQSMIRHGVTHHGPMVIGAVAMVTLMAFSMPVGYILFLLFRWSLIVYGNFP